MQEPSKAVLGGQDRVQAIVDNQRRVKDGRLVKNQPLSSSQVVKSQGPHLKKSVNGYIIFRTAMQHIFSDYTQGQRSPFIREMWAKEIHKPTWSLIGKVFTHIRNFSGGFNSTLQYAVAAIEETRLTQPDRWLNTYNMVLVIDNTGAITLRQHTPPTSIPEPRQLTDVELLFQVLKRGLPVKNPVELLDSLVRSQKHYMTVSDPAAPTGKVDAGFLGFTNDDPFAGMSYLLGLAPTDICFERGINNMDTLGTPRVDDSRLTSPGDDTFGGLDFDETTAHLSDIDNTAINVNAIKNSSQTFEMGVPPQWDDFSGQISEDAYHTANNMEVVPADPYPVNINFPGQPQFWALQ